MLTEVYKIPARPELKSVTTRLGVKDASDKLKESILSAMSMLDIRGICGRAKVEYTPEMVLLEGSEFPGRKFAAYVQGCDSALLLAATAGIKTAHRIEQLMAAGDAEAAVILDAAAAAATDDALGFMVDVWARKSSRLGLAPLDRRFSPGYGDLPLSCQLDIYRLLSAERLDITITEAYMLHPDKSVFAICGLRERR